MVQEKVSNSGIIKEKIMKKVFIISTVGLGYNGITNVVLSYLKAMDMSGMKVYVGATMQIEPEIKNKLKSIGCCIVYLPSRKKQTAAYFFKLIKIIREYQIDVIHAHGNSGTMAIEMLAGWLGGCKKRIAHSHNTSCDQKKADKLLRPIFYLFCNQAVACGKEAGEWLFKKRNFTVLQNGRNIHQFSYKENVREQMRKELHIGKSPAIGHVGGFVPAKNHEFLLKIYSAILQKQPEAKLFLIGDGTLRKEIEKKAEDYKIKERIVFTGNVDKVENLLQGMDAMLLPSLHEGLPLVALEWQIAGLPCIFSDAVTRECVVTDFVEFLSLEESADVWAERILELAETSDRKKNAKEALEKIENSKFDLKGEAERLREIYIGE